MAHLAHPGQQVDPVATGGGLGAPAGPAGRVRPGPGQVRPGLGPGPGAGAAPGEVGDPVGGLGPAPALREHAAGAGGEVRALGGVRCQVAGWGMAR